LLDVSASAASHANCRDSRNEHCGASRLGHDRRISHLKIIDHREQQRRMPRGGRVHIGNAQGNVVAAQGNGGSDSEVDGGDARVVDVPSHQIAIAGERHLVPRESERPGLR